jgi:hypothetical protein
MFVHHMEDDISEHLYRNSDHVVCPLVRIQAHANTHASSIGLVATKSS